MRILKEYLNKDRHPCAGEKMGSTERLEIMTRRGRIQGYYLTPNHAEGELHPAIILLHGFPGVTNNHDIAQMLRNIGFVVFVPNAVGSWGSDGYYSFDGIVESASDVVSYVSGDDICERCHINPSYIFIIGHSMGGFAALNVFSRTTALRAAVFIAPCDLNWHFRCDPEQNFIQQLPIRAGNFLRTEEDLKLNAERIHEKYAFRKAYPCLLRRDFMLIQCEQDLSIPREMLVEFKEKINNGYFESGNQKYLLLNTDHGFNDSKYRVAEEISDFLLSELS